MTDELQQHYEILLRAFKRGRVVPFLGAGVNLCGRQGGTQWLPEECKLLPSGSELSRYLADGSGYPDEDWWDLSRVSQYVSVMRGLGPLYADLHELLDADYPITSLHRFLATLPSILQADDMPAIHDPVYRQQLVVTTNYDDVLERAYIEAGEQFHVVSYVTDGKDRGRFQHTDPVGECRLIEDPNAYDGLFGDVPVILKIHGAVDRSDWRRDSFVITEDHYIDYLVISDVASLLPLPLPERLQRSHLLFLGYGLRDWNLRVVLRRIWGEERLPWKSWAIQLGPNKIDQEFWRRRDVDILDIDLAEYVVGIEERLRPSTGRKEPDAL